MREEIFRYEKYRCRVLVNNIPGIPIVFLHGYSFTSDVWRNIGVLDVLEENNVPYLAIDMPYGVKSSCSPRTRDPSINVAVVVEAVKAYFSQTPPILVGASYGGYISLKYSVRKPVSGLILIAPVNTREEELVKNISSIKTRVLLIWGVRDNVVSKTDMEELASKLQNAELRIYEYAGHPAYLDQPERFKKDVLDFYRKTVG